MYFWKKKKTFKKQQLRFLDILILNVKCSYLIKKVLLYINSTVPESLQSMDIHIYVL